MKRILSIILSLIIFSSNAFAYTQLTRIRNFVNDKNNGVPITSSYMDAELNQILTALNLTGIVQSTQPSSPTNGALWFDSTNKQLKVFRNNEWVVQGVVHVGTSSPTTSQLGDLWYDSTNKLLKGYNGSTYLVIGGSSSTPTTTQGDILYASGTNTLAALAKDANATRYLSNTGTSNNPAWAQVNLANGVVIASQAQGDIIYASSSSAFARLGAGTSGQFLKTQGTSANPIWASINGSSVASFSAYKSNGAAQTTSSTTPLQITFDTEDFDTGSNFASSTFTAPVAGKYLFSSSLDVQVSGSNTWSGQLYIYLNGSVYNTLGAAELLTSTVGASGLSGSIIMNLATNDAITIYVARISGTGNLDIDAGITKSRLTGSLIP